MKLDNSKINIHYGWIVTFVSAFILATQVISSVVSGIVMIPMTTQFGWERGALSCVYSVSNLLIGILGFFFGKLSDTHGPRIILTVAGLITGIGLLLLSYINSLWQAYLVWGLLIGVGRGGCIVPVVSTVPRWFKEKRGIAIGISMSGIGLGGVIWPILAQWLVSSYGWRHSFIVLALISLAIIVPMSQLIKQSPRRSGIQMQEKESLILTSGLSMSAAIRTNRFWMLVLAHLFFMFSVQVLVVHIAPHIVDISFSTFAAANVLSTISVGNIFGRILIGYISDRIGARLTLSICFIIGDFSLIWLILAKEIWMLYLIAAIFGITWGGVVSVGTVLTTELFGLKNIGAILGSIILSGVVGGSLGIPLAGIIFDITHAYNLAFLISIILCTLAAVFSMILLRCKIE